MKNNYNKAYKNNNNYKQNRPSYEKKNEDNIKQSIEDLNEGNGVEHEMIEQNTEVVEENHKKPIYIGIVSNAQKVYMRSEATKDSKPVEIMDEGTEVEIIEDSDPEWYKVCNSACVEGFIMKEFVAI